ncbi:MAG TPA: hypothetical protein VH229_12385 [Candidatus Udaeobacter sp.]|jgi:hypothetical protein|nr:hypothetical protein [Candidatus Udaeobacter sp.]
MKTKIISKLLLSLGLVFVLGSAITQVRGDNPAIPPPGQLLVVTVHSSGDVNRGKTGAFVLRQSASSEQPYFPYYPYVNFSVSGTAIPGVDYVPIVSPARVGPDGYGVILVKTLPDPRGSANRQSYSVVITLDAGLGYAVGQPSSAQMMINP